MYCVGNRWTAPEGLASSEQKSRCMEADLQREDIATCYPISKTDQTNPGIPTTIDLMACTCLYRRIVVLLRILQTKSTILSMVLDLRGTRTETSTTTQVRAPSRARAPRIRERCDGTTCRTGAFGRSEEDMGRGTFQVTSMESFSDQVSPSEKLCALLRPHSRVDESMYLRFA